jgi:transcriptional regulator with PAS, ATPase and Fis domain
VAINCGAIPQNLVESQLFGHVRGAFSGAMKDEPGLVRSAQFGTLLLDEIGDLPASSQAALLRVLQEGEVLPVGSTKSTKVDIRVVAATHMPLESLIEKGAFRRDLYARLAGFSFALTPLRERRADLGLLVAALVAAGRVDNSRALRMDPEAARALVRYDWSMNVRELEQCLRAASVLANDDIITIDDLPAPVASALGLSYTLEDDAPDERDEELRRELLVRMADAKGNVSEVARALGKARQQVQRWVRRFGIDPDAYRPK